MTKKKIAIFDIDGTIFRRNLHFELLNELAYLDIFSHKVREELVHLYGQWLNNEDTYEHYRDKLVELYGCHIKGCDQEAIISASRKVAHFHSKRIYVYAKKILLKLRKDHFLLAISGSPIEIVREYAKIFNFDAFYGSVYEIDKNKVYTGNTIFEPTRDKGAVVKQFVAENDIALKDSFGMGDTESDARFLELVDNPVAFNPNLNLLRIAKKFKWKIIVEKKDVIYEL